MVNYREILKLGKLQYGQRTISQCCTVQGILYVMSCRQHSTAIFHDR